MKNFIAIVLTILVPALAAAQANRGANSPLALTGVTVIDGTGAAPGRDMTIIIKDGRIARIGKRGKVRVPRSASVIGARGKYLIPGLIDTHAHLTWHLDEIFLLSTADQLRLLYLPNGITGLRDASSGRILEQSTSARDEAKKPGVLMPRLSVSGRVDAQRIKLSGLTAGQLTRRLIESGADAIKIRHGLSLDEIRDIVDVARAAGKPVWGHTYYNDDDYTRPAVLAGVRGVTHVLGIPPLGERRRPDPAPTDPADWQASWIYSATNWIYTDDTAADQLIRLMVENGVWLEPTLITEEWVIRNESFRGRPAVKYSVLPFDNHREGFPAPAGKDLKNYTAAFERMKDFVLRFHRSGGLVIAGSDGLPFTGFGLHDELRLLVEAGLTPNEALQAATRNAARALGWEQEVGTIEPGKEADLVLLDADPLAGISATQKIYAVVTRGRFLSRADLDRMLAEAEAKIKNKSGSR